MTKDGFESFSSLVERTLKDGNEGTINSSEDGEPTDNTGKGEKGSNS